MKGFDYRSIARSQRLLKHSKLIDKLNELEQKNELPNNLLVSIFLIESHCRPTYFRMGEYILLLLEFLANKIFMNPIKNLTLGRCQIGISTILNYCGGKYYTHLEYISSMRICELICIIKNCIRFEQFKILVYCVKPMYLRARKIYPNDYENLIIYIGEQFNGRYVYGILLVEIMEVLSLVLGIHDGQSVTA